MLKELLGMGRAVDRMRLLNLGFQIGLMREPTISAADVFLNELSGLMSAMFHPKSAVVVACDGWSKDPSDHENYLVYDKDK